ncbi:hypothetical protein B0J11DRAFT_503015 [Dendryphion nanum]|uniref:Zn(2)-C6 fungal-type domain-containing protein n=1 Tax=Dendryphion nanum TaxID=256645 RepID=A0A9P9E4L2_9PLEO|nr:hypothetical protein B0J11DRAFT_503015 [Dendryphion nanum]
MFGTLISDLRQKEPLTFVENKNPASALSRNRRDKPHLSCQFCRSRKIRCSGESSGCERCVSLSIECRYESRRKKRSVLGSIGVINPAIDNGNVEIFGSDQEGSQEQVVEKDSKNEAQQQQQFKDSDWAAQCLTDLGTGKHLNTDGKRPGWGNNGSPNPSVTGHFEDWMDMDSFLTSPLSTSHSNISLHENRKESTLPDLNNFVNFDNSIAAHPSTSSLFGGDSIQSSGISTPFEVNQVPSPLNNITNEGDLQAIEDWQPLAQFLDFQESRPDSQKQITGPEFQSMMSMPNFEMPGPAVAARAMLSSSMQQTGSSVSCSCREFTTLLFEELCAESAASDQESLDALFGHFRGAMSHTATILDCNLCRLQLEGNMLLAMAGHYMGIMCERMVECYVQLKHETKDTEISKDDVAGEIWFSNYRIDNKTERMQVLSSLVWVQLAEFSNLIERLKRRVGVRSGPGALLSETDKKLAAFLCMCESGGQDSLVYRWRLRVRRDVTETSMDVTPKWSWSAGQV